MDVYEQYGIKRVINASGKMTILGGSRVSEEVASAMNQGAENFFLIADLQAHVEAYLKDLLGVPGVRIVASASSGIAQCVGAVIAQDRLAAVLDPYCCQAKRREIVIPKGHVVNYGAPISLPIGMGGGIVVEAGYANECTQEEVAHVINENTAALLYVKSHHCVQKSMLSIEEMVALAKQYHLPLIIDAAAEESLTDYIALGADAVIYSGTKALGGPTSGLVIAREPLLSHLKLQAKGLGRVMKVGKESILGLAQAVQSYIGRPSQSLEKQRERLTAFHEKVQQFPGVEVKAVQDDAGRKIVRSQIHLDRRYDARKIAAQLKQGDPMIFTRDYRLNMNILEIDIRDVSDCELEIIGQRLGEIIRAENG